MRSQTTLCADRHPYEMIKEYRVSEAAKIIFARQQETQQAVVIKVLREYKDTRYHLRTLQQRQRCQMESLQWNQRFTQDVYHGLATDYSSLQDNAITPGEVLYLGKVCNDPAEAQKRLDPTREYALVMNLLPEDRRVDSLLEAGEESENSLLTLLEVLTERIVHMHTSCISPIGKERFGPRWGSLAQIKKKLEHNLGLFDLVPGVVGNDPRYQQYYWLKDALRRVVRLPHYAYFFKVRTQQNRIKRCHGDLKAANIWINRRDTERDRGSGVKILDAIDFNPGYSNIDVLSDIAMLVVDIEARTSSPLLAEGVIQNYLRLTHQETDAIARAVLQYYLIEKAIVRAAISIVYDGLPELGLSFLRVAEKRLKDLDLLLDISIASACYYEPGKRNGVPSSLHLPYPGFARHLHSVQAFSGMGCPPPAIASFTPGAANRRGSASTGLRSG